MWLGYISRKRKGWHLFFFSFLFFSHSSISHNRSAHNVSYFLFSHLITLLLFIAKYYQVLSLHLHLHLHLHLRLHRDQSSTQSYLTLLSYLMTFLFALIYQCRERQFHASYFPSPPNAEALLRMEIFDNSGRCEVIRITLQHIPVLILALQINL